MQLTHLKLTNFKNYETANIAFKKHFVCFTGKNGMGKTNLLDAVYYLAIGKSYFISSDRLNIKHEQAYFTLEGEFENKESNESVNIFCGFQPGRKKTIKKNKAPYERISDHLGLIPVIIITPTDIKIIIGGSEDRRRFLDNIMSQIDKTYMQALITYNRTLEQRNAELRNNEGRSLNKDLMAVYDEKLAEKGQLIYDKRKGFISAYNPEFERLYHELCGGSEKVSMTYESMLRDNDPAKLLKQNFQRDVITQRTNCGIHKDDLSFEIGGYPARKFGSQGQQKSLLLAMKMAQLPVMKQAGMNKPLLLLDDIFDRLDDTRVANLVRLIQNNYIGQTFITDTSSERAKSILLAECKELEIFEIENGKLS